VPGQMSSVSRTVRDSYASLAVRDDEGMIAGLAEGVEMHTLTGSFRGRDGVRQWLAQMDEGWDPWELRIEELTELGERVLIELTLVARSTLNGIAMSQRYWAVWELRDGRPAIGIHFGDRAQAVQAAEAPRLEFLPG
jgi:ketosteroid isomerase-like protein